MSQPFSGIKVIDLTHVLAGPFAGYQLAVLGAEVIKVELRDFPDQSRELGPDKELNKARMATGYLTQASNKKCITLNLKTEKGREILKKLIADCDVFIENYRPGALENLGLGFEDLSKINERMIYCSISAYGHQGSRRELTAYDHVIQASCGIMMATGTKEVNPLKTGAPVIDYSTGTTGAFAIASALFQRERTGRGQRIDVAMFDVAMILQGYLITGYLRTGVEPKPNGNDFPYATNSAYDAKSGIIMLGASNLRQQQSLWVALERPDMAKKTNVERDQDRDREAALLREIMLTRTADEWEAFFQRHRVPASRVRSLAEALADPHVEKRGVLHRLDGIPGVDGSAYAPVAAFNFAHGGPAITSLPARIGEHNDEIFAGLGYTKAEIEDFRAGDVI